MEQADRYPSFRHLRLFENLSRYKSVSRAAQSENLSQPAASKAIAKLERRFGVQLLTRARAGCQLTPFGEIVLDHVQRLLASAQLALGELYSGTPPIEGSSINAILSKITPTQIRYLIAISESTSFEEAAETLGVAEPSLQRAARHLERVVRRGLYARSVRGMTTSLRGAEFARRLRVALKEIEYAAENINTKRGILASRISVGSLTSLGSLVVARAVNEFVREYPEARVHVIEGAYDLLLDQLRRGNIECFMGVFRPGACSPDIAEQLLFSQRYVIVARHKHPLANVKAASQEQLAQYDWIVSDPTTTRYRAFRRIFPSRKLAPRTQIEVASRAMIRTLLTMSDRLALLSHTEAALEESLEILRIIDADVPLSIRECGLITRSAWRPTVLQNRFLEILRSYGTEAAAKPTQ